MMKIFKVSILIVMVGFLLSAASVTVADISLPMKAQSMTMKPGVTEDIRGNMPMNMNAMRQLIPPPRPFPHRFGPRDILFKMFRAVKFLIVTIVFSIIFSFTFKLIVMPDKKQDQKSVEKAGKKAKK